MDHVTLREYRQGDRDAMYALDVECFEPVFRFSRRAMQGFAEARGAISVLAVSAGELAGFCVAQMEDRVGYVVTLDVAAPWRRKGLARSLMAALEEKVRAAGGQAMALHVFTGNQAAIRLYEGIGYGRVGTAEGFYGPGRDALIYGRHFE
jgi:[ribosomal protein S18]-alanine N-acetyltransferase